MPELVIYLLFVIDGIVHFDISEHSPVTWIPVEDTVSDQIKHGTKGVSSKLTLHQEVNRETNTSTSFIWEADNSIDIVPNWLVKVYAFLKRM